MGFEQGCDNPICLERISVASVWTRGQKQVRGVGEGATVIVQAGEDGGLHGEGGCRGGTQRRSAVDAGTTGQLCEG